MLLEVISCSLRSVRHACRRPFGAIDGTGSPVCRKDSCPGQRARSRGSGQPYVVSWQRPVAPSRQ